MLSKSNQSNKSTILNEQHKQMQAEGRHLTDDSEESEKQLTEAMQSIIAYAKERFKYIASDVIHKKTISLYECQEYFSECSGILPNPENKKVYMKPDGGNCFYTK